MILITYTSYKLDYSVCDHNQKHTEKKLLFIRKPISDGKGETRICG